jgi:hypothetical protein
LSEARKRRNSRVLELLAKQKEEREAREAEESGGDQPFPDLRAELGLGDLTGDGEK